MNHDIQVDVISSSYTVSITTILDFTTEPF